MNASRARIVYVVHSGQAFGTERIALATLAALQDRGETLLVAPPGPAHELAREMGIASVTFGSPWQLLRVLASVLQARGSLLFTTGLVHTLCASVLRLLRPGRFRELHMVHGGTDEHLSYGRKRHVARLGVRLVAISRYVRERLVAHGVDAGAISVVPNFADLGSELPRAPAERVRRVLVVSRADPIKRLDLLVQALRVAPGLAPVQFDVLGSGADLEALRAMAADLPNLRFHGYVDDVPRWMAQADLLLHTCPQEPFGLAILEAFRARVPVLVPDTGGAAELVSPGHNGWRYRGGDATDLASALLRAEASSAATRERVAGRAHDELARRYSPEAITNALWNLA